MANKIMLVNILIFVLVFLLQCCEGQNSKTSDSCNANIDLDLAFETSKLSCTKVWLDSGFILRYEQFENVLNILLSAPYPNAWVAMGFSTNGMMVTSRAMVGWLKSDQTGIIHQYYLGGKSSSAVTVDKSNGLDVVPNATRVHYQGSTIYLSFQLLVEGPVKTRNILFAYGSSVPANTQLSIHKDKFSTAFDFSTGRSSSADSIDTLRRNHGALNIFAWGVLLPIGSIIARYCRQWDPAWFYLHTGFQASGFIFGFAGVVLGAELYNKMKADFPAHRGLGIFIIVLGILQVTALLFRPQKEAKLRKYWNWYHHWAGRIVLFLAAVNIVYGINEAKPGKSWKAGYGIVLACLLLTFIVLESLLWIRRYRRPPQAPSFQMY